VSLFFFNVKFFQRKNNIKIYIVLDYTT